MSGLLLLRVQLYMLVNATDSTSIPAARPARH
jgi:hypothetical protein